MAKKLSSFPDELLKPDGTTKHNYPWHVWANGDVWQLERGEDFHVTTMNFVARARGHAKSNGKDLLIATRGTTVTLQFSERKTWKPETLEG